MGAHSVHLFFSKEEDITRSSVTRKKQKKHEAYKQLS